MGKASVLFCGSQRNLPVRSAPITLRKSLKLRVYFLLGICNWAKTLPSVNCPLPVIVFEQKISR